MKVFECALVSNDMDFRDNCSPEKQHIQVLSHNPKAESSETNQVWVEKPIYSMDFYSENMAESARKEGITAFVVLPLKYSNEIIGSLNFVSLTLDNVQADLSSTAYRIKKYTLSMPEFQPAISSKR